MRLDHHHLDQSSQLSFDLLHILTSAFNQVQAVLRDCFGRLAIDGGGWELGEESEGGGVCLSEGWKGIGVGGEAGDTGRGLDWSE